MQQNYKKKKGSRSQMRMDLVRLHLMLLIVVSQFLSESCGNSSHSLTILYTLISEPPTGYPQFVAMAYVDDLLVGSFDSNTKRAHPAATWMEKVEKDTSDFWEWVTQKLMNSERRFRDDLQVFQRHNNQSGGFHTWQRRLGCEVSDDGYRGGFLQYAYDGRDLIHLDTETFTCEVADAKAQVLKRRWEADPALQKSCKGFLDEECPDWLLKFMEYGNETLRRRETPMVKVTRRTTDENQEILICMVHGFYPREIEATWRRDGEVWEHRTLRRPIAPNSDGTYYAWLSVDIDPTERRLFCCHVDHASLPEPLVLAWEEPVSHYLRGNWGILPVLFLVMLLLVSAFWIQSKLQRRAGLSKSRTRSKKGGESVPLSCSQQFADFARVSRRLSVSFSGQPTFSPATAVHCRSHSF